MSGPLLQRFSPAPELLLCGSSEHLITIRCACSSATKIDKFCMSASSLKAQAQSVFHQGDEACCATSRTSSLRSRPLIKDKGRLSPTNRWAQELVDVLSHPIKSSSGMPSSGNMVQQEPGVSPAQAEFLSVGGSVQSQTPSYSGDAYSNIPLELNSAGGEPRLPNLGKLINGPKGKDIQDCARKCVVTCIRGGEGAPGLGPLSMRREMMAFKEGYRSRSYCLSECTQVCALASSATSSPMLTSK